MVVLFLVFWGPSILFSTAAALIYIPTNSVQGFPFLHIRTNFCYLSTFWWGKRMDFAVRSAWIWIACILFISCVDLENVLGLITSLPQFAHWEMGKYLLCWISCENSVRSGMQKFWRRMGARSALSPPLPQTCYAYGTRGGPVHITVYK